MPAAAGSPDLRRLPALNARRPAAEKAAGRAVA